MMLGDDFKYAHLVKQAPTAVRVKKTRRVRDPEYWGAPYNTPITPAMRAAKRAEKAAKKTGPSADGQASKPSGTSSSGSKTVRSKTGKHTMPEDARFHPGSKKYAAHKKKIADQIESAKTMDDLLPVLEALETDRDLSDEDHEALVQRAGVIGRAYLGGDAGKPSDSDSVPPRAESKPKPESPPDVNERDKSGESKPKPESPEPPTVKTGNDDPEERTVEPSNVPTVDLKSHFAGGGSVADAPSNGLVRHLATNPERFKARKVGSGTSPVSVYTDKDTGEKWYAKTLPQAGEEGYKAEEENELLASLVGELDSVVTPKAKVDHGPGGPHLVTQDIGQVGGADLDSDLTAKAKRWEKTFDAIPDGEMSAIGESIRDGKDPGQAMRLALYDYLIDNGDRHAMNVHFGKDENGNTVLGVLDNGQAFAAGGHYGSANDDENPMDFFDGYPAFHPNGVVADDSKKVTDPRRYAVAPGGWNLSEIIFSASVDSDDMAKHFDDAVKGFEKVTEDGILGRMPDNLTPEREEEWRAWAAAVQRRVTLLKDAREEFLAAMEGGDYA